MREDFIDSMILQIGLLEPSGIVLLPRPTDTKTTKTP